MLGVTRLPDGNYTVTDGDTFRLCRSGQEMLERTAEALGVHAWYADLERERDEALARAKRCSCVGCEEPVVAQLCEDHLTNALSGFAIPAAAPEPTGEPCERSVLHVGAIRPAKPHIPPDEPTAGEVPAIADTEAELDRRCSGAARQAGSYCPECLGPLLWCPSDDAGRCDNCYHQVPSDCWLDDEGMEKERRWRSVTSTINDLFPHDPLAQLVRDGDDLRRRVTALEEPPNEVVRRLPAEAAYGTADEQVRRQGPSLPRSDEARADEVTLRKLRRAGVEAAIYQAMPCAMCAQLTCSIHRGGPNQATKQVEAIAREVVAGALEMYALHTGGTAGMEVAKRLREGAQGGGDRG